MMKKFFAALLCGALAVVMAGCSGSDENLVAVNANQDLAEVTKAASAADMNTVKLMLASYDAAIIQANKELAKSHNDFTKVKIVDVNKEESTKLRKDMADYQTQINNLEAQKKLYLSRLAALEIANAPKQ